MSAKQLTNYEKEQLKEIEKFQNEKPSVISQGLGLIGKPLEVLTSILIPESLMKAILESANSAAEFLADESDILRDGKVSSIEELRNSKMEACDKLADNVHDWAIGLATAEGGVAGALGGVGFAVDIPTILTLSLRTIHKIGLCYGYKADNIKEREYVLKILSLAGSNTIAEKNQVLVQLKLLENTMKNQLMWMIERKAVKDMANGKIGNEVIIKIIKDLCKQLGINFSKRKAMQIIPFMGAGIGAVMNGSFIRDVGYAARRQYQERWLLENGKIKLDK